MKPEKALMNKNVMFWKKRKKKLKVGSPEWIEELNRLIKIEQDKGNMVSDEIAEQRLEKMFGKIFSPEKTENNSLDAQRPID